MRCSCAGISPRRIGSCPSGKTACFAVVARMRHSRVLPAASITHGRSLPLQSQPDTTKPMNPRKLQPSGDHVLIQYADAALSVSVATESSPRDKKPSAAKVIAVGPGREGADGTTVPLGLKVGERVFVDRTCGIKIRLNRQSYAVVRKRDLISSRP